MATMLNEALDYARRGWYVFPCREKPGAPYIKDGVEFIPREKTPYTAKGLNDASIDNDQITAWWTQWPSALIGVNAGKSGLFVIDIDKKHINGLDTFTEWNINDSAGLHSKTPSGGFHIVFTGSGKSSTNGKTGIDTRGEGGYFIVPPSFVSEGEFSGAYEYVDDWGRTPGIIPDGLMLKLFPDQTINYTKGNFIPQSGDKKVLSRTTLTFLVEGAMPGERNSKLFNALADYAGCGYSKDEARESVLPVSQRIGLPDYEFEQVLEHAYSKKRTSSIPDEIQEKIKNAGKDVTKAITPEEELVLENTLLACLMVDNSFIPVVQDILYAEDFQAIKNRIIYKAISRLYNGGMKADYLTVANEVAKETDKVKLDDISKLINIYFVNLDNTLTYAYIIREKSSIKRLEALMDNKGRYLQIGNLPEMVNALEKDISDIAVYGGAKSTSVLSGQQAADMVTELTRKLANGEIEQLKTGFVDYDNYLGGVYSNELIICAGRAGEGKSALALSICNYVSITKNIPSLFFTLEMSTHETVCRLICQLTGIPFKKVYQGKLSENEWRQYLEAMDKIRASSMYFDDGFGMTIPEIRSKIRKMAEKGIKLAVIDQLEQVKGYDGLPEHVRYDRIAYDIKEMTKEFDIPIILPHQLNRNITDRRLKNPEPQLSDLNQAGEKPANQVWAIMHLKDEKGNILQSKIKILKNRNGATIEFPVIFLKERMLFSNPVHEEDKHAFSNKDAEIYDDSQKDPDWID